VAFNLPLCVSIRLTGKIKEKQLMLVLPISKTIIIAHDQYNLPQIKIKQQIKILSKQQKKKVS
jgi:hypothetical protein